MKKTRAGTPARGTSPRPAAHKGGQVGRRPPQPNSRQPKRNPSREFKVIAGIFSVISTLYQFLLRHIFDLPDAISFLIGLCQAALQHIKITLVGIGGIGVVLVVVFREKVKRHLLAMSASIVFDKKRAFRIASLIMILFCFIGFANARPEIFSQIVRLTKTAAHKVVAIFKNDPPRTGNSTVEIVAHADSTVKTVPDSSGSIRDTGSVAVSDSMRSENKKPEERRGLRGKQRRAEEYIGTKNSVAMPVKKSDRLPLLDQKLYAAYVQKDTPPETIAWWLSEYEIWENRQQDVEGSSGARRSRVGFWKSQFEGYQRTSGKGE